MKNLFITISLSILLISCGGNGSTSPDLPEVAPAKSNILKINTILYGEYGENANHLISISVSNNSGFTDYTMEALNKGIKIATGSTISIKVQSDIKEEYENNILWTGYSFANSALAQKKEIEMIMDSDIYLTLVTTDSPDATIDIATLLFSVTAPEAFTDVGVKVDNYMYVAGTYELFFAMGQSVALEAITTTNEKILFLGFQTTSGITKDTNTTIKLNDVDTTIQADFVDKDNANVTVTITGINPLNGTIYVNGVKVEQNNDEKKLTNVVVKNQSIGQRIILKAEPVGSKKFVSWGDDLKGYLSDKAGYEYIVSDNATINPVFSEPEGVITVSIYPRTNYFTGQAQHPQNKISYTVEKSDGQLVKKSDDSSIPHLTWENNTITELAPGYVVKLKALPGEGFYGDKISPTKVKWSGSADGTGLEKTIAIGSDGLSKGVNVAFEIEKRKIIVKLDTQKQIDPYDLNSSTWVKELDTTEDGKGYTIFINNVAYKDVKTASAIFDWHTKVDIRVDGGKNYEATNSIEQYNDGITPQNPDNETDYNGENTAKISTLTLDLEENNTVTAILHHKRVNMVLNIIGGKFDNSGEIAATYNGFVNVKGTGYSSIADKRYDTAQYYDGVNGNSSVSSISPKKYTIPMLSGIQVNIYANPNSATLFRTHAGDLIPAGLSSGTNVTIKNIGEDFDVTSTFYAPIWALTVNMKGNLLDGDKLTVEPNEYNVPDYQYSITPLGNAVATVSSASKQFPVTNGLPVLIRATPATGGHYNFHSISGADVGANTMTVISTNNSVVQINFTHNIRNMKLNIIGGKDDGNQSYVRVSGTGISEYNKTYYASNRNTLANGSIIAPISYNFKVLSGIRSKVKVETITSKVHNLDYISKKYGNDLAYDSSYEGKRGNGSYSLANSATLIEVPPNDSSEVDVAFRINSYKGALNGLNGKDFGGANSDPVAPPTSKSDDILIHDVYSAYQLMYLVKSDSSFEKERIRLMSDIYIGNDVTFNGFEKEFKGSFIGNGFIVYDLAITKRGFFHAINEAQIISLTTARGYISGEDNKDNVGVIGESVRSSIKYVTNSAKIGNLNTVNQHNGSIVGLLRGEGETSYLANYGNVEGNLIVGGVIGRLDYAYHNNSYIFNRGSVKGKSRVGGIVGQMDAHNQIYKTYNTGNVVGTAGDNYTGGIVGVMGWARFGKERRGDNLITDFYNTGDVAGGSGIVGVIVGCREIMNNGVYDNDMSTTSFQRGYSIGNYQGASMISFAGHYSSNPTDNGSYHKIDIVDVYIHDITGGTTKPLLSGLGKNKDIDDRLYDSDVSGGYLTKGSPGAVTFYYNNGSYFSGETGDAGNIKKALVTFSTLNTSLYAFSDNSIWVQGIGLPSANGYTSRPTFRDMPERDLPSYMLEY